MPEKLKDAVFYWSHCHVTAGHFGIIATIQRAKSKFYYPGMSTDMRTKVKTCSDCLAKITKINLKKGIHKPIRTGYPGDQIFIDLIGPLPETQDNKRYVLSVEDGFTKYSCAYAIPNKEATTVAKTLLDEYLCIFGLPAKIHSDNGGKFVNQVIEQLLDRLQIKKSTTPTYNPQSNLVERWHRTLNAMLRIFMEREDTQGTDI